MLRALEHHLPNLLPGPQKPGTGRRGARAGPKQPAGVRTASRADACGYPADLESWDQSPQRSQRIGVRPVSSDTVSRVWGEARSASIRKHRPTHETLSLVKRAHTPTSTGLPPRKAKPFPAPSLSLAHEQLARRLSAAQTRIRYSASEPALRALSSASPPG